MSIECGCYRCSKERYDLLPEKEKLPMTGGWMGMMRMFLCEKCGNKRCPHATDHRLECTGSNESGQKGSRYE